MVLKLKKNINNFLLVSPRAPIIDLKTGGLTVIRKIFEYYSERYRLILISRYSPSELNYIAEIKSCCDQCILIPKYTSNIKLIAYLQKIHSYILLYYYTNKYLKNKKIDVVQFEWIESKIFVRVPRNIVSVIDTHDVRFKLLNRKFKNSSNFIIQYITLLKYYITKCVEIFSLYNTNFVLTKSLYDKKIFEKYINAKNIYILSCPIKKELLAKKWSVCESEKKILFVGELNRDENHRSIMMFINKIWPEFTVHYPNYELRIVGMNPRSELIKKCTKYNNIKLLGYVDDIISEYKIARVFISPLVIGGGIIVKNIDSLTFGIPTVTTTYGNQGIEAINRKHIMIANKPWEFFKCIEEIIKSDSFSQSLSDNGRKYIKVKFVFDKELEGVNKMITESFLRS